MIIARKISCLSAALVGILLSCSVMAESRFSYSTDGAEVIDNQTGLIWRRCSEGQSWSGSTCTGTARTFLYGDALAHAESQAGWRLPNIKELSSIADKSRLSPTIDITAFPAPGLAAAYWSSSNGWLIYFHSGTVMRGSRSPVQYVRLVR